jgi:hypothetical protein
MILRTFDKPTNVFIIGDMVDYGDNYGLTDDFSSVDVTIGEDKLGIETTGFFSILSENELIEFIIRNNLLEVYDEEKIYDECGIVLLKNYSGDIEGILLDDNDQEINFSKLEYIYHNEDNSYDFTVSISKTEYKNLEYDEFIEYCKMLKTLYDREMIIDKILK